MDHIEVKINKISPSSAKGSVHVEVESGGFTISNILLRKDAGQLKISLPLISIGDQKRPAITLQGELKNRIMEELEQAYQQSTYMK
ncbi:hypothetical protein KQI82_08920 [Oscillibacter sp. MSJ-2]|uniref:Uncharacterized protein n=1 Tax=Dysosmobacter acutus TaxID=2841504 RepID=A0ABS6FA24_9FIRM|nr:hypothetical protein [Dysosmobacter acutus]MBU5627027.1 hypothetical protein [Dysosmobacter acutus]